MNELKETLKQLQAEDPTFNGEVKLVFAKEPIESSREEPIVRLVTEAYHNTAGEYPGYGSEPVAGGDLYFLRAELGTPYVFFGPGSIVSSHTPDEYVEINKLVDGAKTYAHAILKACEAI